MKIDVISIFPEYLAALELSLIGKARTSGLLDLSVHNLRDWTTDKHRTVDDTPAGGGAGMVMRADVWGAALDDVLGAAADADADEGANGDVEAGATEGGPVLLIPTPTGRVFDQRMAEELAGEDHLVFACGRYEGIDARVGETYAQRVRVVEFSIGDYVLNGGEVAALVAIEAIGRLAPGVVGNPESLIEESHGAAGLLEYPVYTRPTSWRGADIPDVLLSGDHARIARWRRRKALARTAKRRPDMLIDRAEPLSMEDKLALISEGFVLIEDEIRGCEIRGAGPEDAAAVAELARRTFPDACPPELPPEAISDFMETFLTPVRFVGYLADPERRIWVASANGQLLAYCMLVMDLRPEDEEGASEVRHHLPRGLVAEVSKFYVDPIARGSGLGRALMAHVLHDCASASPTIAGLWLGTNRSNTRAITFYERCGWKVTGSRTFDVGGQPQDDVIITVPKLAKYATPMAD